MSSSNNSNNLVTTLLTSLIRCFAPSPDQQQQQQQQQQQHQQTQLNQPSSDSPIKPTTTSPSPLHQTTNCDNKPPMSESETPFSYADAVASNVEEPQPDEDTTQPVDSSAFTDGAATANPDDDDEAVETALSESEGSAKNAAAQLWKLDTVNRLKVDQDYRVNIGRKARSYEEDHASEPFIEFISDSVWEDRPTWGLFKKLLDNYVAETGVPERQSQEEMAEEWEFLEAVLQTTVGKFTHRWLVNHGHADEDVQSFKQVLHGLWFGLYGRDGGRDSSGFEHAFCGEIDDGKVKGLHNFVQVYVEEQRGNFDYRGFLTYGRDRGEYVEDADRIITIRFQWLEHLKPASSMFIGVSPEFELCLYTLLWLSGSAGETVELGPYDVTVKVYDMHGKIGAAFPELTDVDYDNPDAYLE